MTEREAFEAGYKAGMSNAIPECPYQDQPLRDAWHDGYMEAEMKLLDYGAQHNDD